MKIFDKFVDGAVFTSIKKEIIYIHHNNDVVTNEETRITGGLSDTVLLETSLEVVEEVSRSLLETVECFVELEDETSIRIIWV